MTYHFARAVIAVTVVLGLGLASFGDAAASGRVARGTVIAGSASTLANRSPSVGRVPGAQTANFEVVLHPRDEVQAEALALAVSTPGSPQFHDFLTPQQWEMQFSPTRGQVQEVTSWLHSQHLRVRSVSSDRLALAVSGTIGDVENAFSTTLTYHAVDDQRLRLIDTDLVVPSSFADLVAGTVGLDGIPSSPDVAGRRRQSRISTGKASSASPRPPAATVDSTNCASFYGERFDTASPPYGNGIGEPVPDVVCGYTPADMRYAYDVSGNVADGDTGAGETVAVIDAYLSPTLLADAQTYARLNDPSHPLSSSQFTFTEPRAFNMGRSCVASGWFTEQTVDVEAVHAMAPGANILYVAAQNCQQGLYDALRTVVDRHEADVVSASWGDNGGDLVDDAATRASVDGTLIMAAATGVTVIFASGDQGDEFTTVGTSAPDYPASSPWATAVGGTSLELGFGLRETGWSTALSTLCTSAVLGAAGCSSSSDFNTWLPPTFNMGSGGGTSYRYPQPPYQTGVVPTALATRNSATVGPAPMRVEPDISMDGDPGTGLLVGITQHFVTSGVHYGQFRAGGTSLSAPLFAGVVALADQLAGRSLGFVNPGLYSLARSQPGVIRDVVPGPPQAMREFAVFQTRQHRVRTITEVLTRIVDYEGIETFCQATCVNQNVSLSTAPGYDDMTGLGAPGPGFVQALAKT